jgi:hypothetical protein
MAFISKPLKIMKKAQQNSYDLCYALSKNCQFRTVNKCVLLKKSEKFKFQYLCDKLRY